MFKFKCQLCDLEFDNVDDVWKHLKDYHNVDRKYHVFDLVETKFDDKILKDICDVLNVDDVTIKNFGYAGIWVDVTISAYMVDFFWKRVVKFMQKIIDMGIYPISCNNVIDEEMEIWVCSLYLEYDWLDKIVGGVKE